MFELSVARKYLIPRVRQLSVSIISLISVFVIAIVVWLSIVFFSAQEGIERSWTEKMVALTGPLRLTPTPAYYNSYYYQIDAYSERSGYAYKSLREKLHAKVTDPFQAESDATLPRDFPQNEHVDIIKETMHLLEGIPSTTSTIFETAQGQLQLRLVREFGPFGNFSEQELSANTYLMGMNEASKRLVKSKLPLDNEDRKNMSKARVGYGILLPKSFKEAGVLAGDEGNITYKGFGATATQELRSKVRVAGFYDPGILPIGGKVALVPDELISQILSASFSQESGLPTGITVDFSDLKNAQEIKEKIVDLLKAKGLLRYWQVQTYDEYDFTKDIFQQMRSDKNLFSLISIIITIVACSNIISMLIILVRDKRKEVAILRALGASSGSIAFIFGLCGFLLGAVGSLIGAIFAVFTLKNLSGLLALLGKLQGFEVLHSTFYANSLPNEVSVPSLIYVLIMAALLSCLAGLVPAIQASRINTSEALRNE